MCYVSPEAIAKGIAEYNEKIKDEYLRDVEAFKAAVARLGFVFAEGAKGQVEYAETQEDYLCGGEWRPLVLEVVWSYRNDAGKEKAPASSEVEPINQPDEPTCHLCKRSYDRCRCLPL